MQLIVTKVIKIPPKTGENQGNKIVSGECAFIDGITDDTYNSVKLKIDKMTAGKYLVFYTAKFQKQQLCRRLNIIFYAPYEIKLKRLSARKFGASYLEELQRMNFKRQQTENYL